MGLPRSASAVGALWHCDVPSLPTTKLTLMLQCISRAYVSASKGNALPQLLVNDLRSVASDTKGPFYCRPFLHELNEIKKKHPEVTSFPMSKASIKAISEKVHKSEWVAQSTVKHRRAKPSVGVSAFFKRDAKPTLCIRSRICFGVALTPQRHHLYKHTPTPLCSSCGVVGDLDHVLFHCKLYAFARGKCESELQQLYFPVQLTREVIYGVPPPAPRGFSDERAFLSDMHARCLKATSNFINTINGINRL